MPLRTHMLAVCHRGVAASRPTTRLLASHKAHTALPPVGRQWLRPSTIMPITDVHTHHSGNLSAIYNLTTPVETVPAGPVSVGLHPWDTALPDVETLMLAINHRAVTDAAVVAIGETGLDNRHGAPLSRQEQLLIRHIHLSELTHKPLILHIVGAWSELLRLHRDMRPSVPWIIHGFRGKPALARQLLDAGMYLSLGRQLQPIHGSHNPIRPTPA